MKRIFIVLFAVAVLGLAGWLGLRALGGEHPLASVAIPMSAPQDLPDTPAEWHGRIDYRALDGQLADLSRRPEMAGLAVAVVEDGKLTFVRTYGVSDSTTGAPVTPNTLFRWASVSKTATAAAAPTCCPTSTRRLAGCAWPSASRCALLLMRCRRTFA